MRVVLPTIEYKSHGVDLAARPSTLDGKVIGFLDGWGERREDGSFTMYPLMQEVWKQLQARFDVKGPVWVKKPNISKPVPESMLSGFLTQVDVVINGEAA